MRCFSGRDPPPFSDLRLAKLGRKVKWSGGGGVVQHQQSVLDSRIVLTDWPKHKPMAQNVLEANSQAQLLGGPVWGRHADF